MTNGEQMTASQDGIFEPSIFEPSIFEPSIFEPSIFERGVAMRRRVLGGDHVDRVMADGCSRDQIREALLQTAVYCGAPAALESFRVAERVLTEMGVE